MRRCHTWYVMATGSTGQRLSTSMTCTVTGTAPVACHSHAPHATCQNCRASDGAGACASTVATRGTCVTAATGATHLPQPRRAASGPAVHCEVTRLALHDAAAVADADALGRTHLRGGRLDRHGPLAPAADDEAARAAAAAASQGARRRWSCCRGGRSLRTRQRCVPRSRRLARAIAAVVRRATVTRAWRARRGALDNHAVGTAAQGSSERHCAVHRDANHTLKRTNARPCLGDDSALLQHAQDGGREGAALRSEQQCEAGTHLVLRSPVTVGGSSRLSSPPATADACRRYSATSLTLKTRCQSRRRRRHRWPAGGATRGRCASARR